MSETPLEILAEKAGVSFDNLMRARHETCEGLTDFRAKLAKIELRPANTAVVLMGSWGRAEATKESDHDFVILNGATPERDLADFKRQVEDVLDTPPSNDGPFAEPVGCGSMIEQIGLQEDSNHHLTRRMLFLLESVPVLGDDVYRDLGENLLDRYVDDSVKDERPPRFLLNDVIRYWRTICVDFAAKEHQGGDKWGIRNAKLRTSRKVLFAAGLLPVLQCHAHKRAEMAAYLREQFESPPTDRIASVFLNHNMVDTGARMLDAYDEFMGLLNEPDFRQRLRIVKRENAKDSPEFEQAREIGRKIEASLNALLFESKGKLPSTVRQYAIF